MNIIKDKVSKILIQTIKELYAIDIHEIKLENPPKKELGDFCFGPFLLAKSTGKNPALISNELKNALQYNSNFLELTIAGPYLNFKLSYEFYTQLFLHEIQTIPQIGNGKTVVVDYIGANVGKPLHIGHMCTPNQGQVTCNLFRLLGYNVIGDSHIGDWGIIFGKLILAYKLWGNEAALKENAVNHLFELYVKITAETEKESKFLVVLTDYRFKLGEKLPTKDIEKLSLQDCIDIENKISEIDKEYLINIKNNYTYDSISELYSNFGFEEQTRQEFKALSQGEGESVKLWQSFTNYSIAAMQVQLNRLNVKPDFDIGESFYEGIGLPKMGNYPDLQFKMSDIVKELIDKKVATKNEDGSVGVDFGDALPSCMLQKRDGTHGYLASDLASIKYRMIHWNPEKIIYHVDVRQQLHLSQAFEIAKNAEWLGNTQLFHAYNGFISLKDGAMSTRKGNIIKLDALLDEAVQRAKNIVLEKNPEMTEKDLAEISEIIGIGAIKYGYLSKGRTTDMIFDWDEFMTFEGNSFPYVAYSYVRALRVLEKSGISLETITTSKISEKFSHPEQVSLYKEISALNETLIGVSENITHHNLVMYGYNLAKSFSSFYNSVTILNEENGEKKMLNLKLIHSYLETQKIVFAVLAITLPTKM